MQKHIQQPCNYSDMNCTLHSKLKYLQYYLVQQRPNAGFFSQFRHVGKMVLFKAIPIVEPML